MASRSLGFAALLASALALGACSTVTNPGAPDQSFDIDQDIQDLEEAFKTKGTTIISFYSTDAEGLTAVAEKATDEAEEATASAEKAAKEAERVIEEEAKASAAAIEASAAADKATQEKADAISAAEATPDDEEAIAKVETATAEAEKAIREAAEANAAAEKATLETTEAVAAAGIANRKEAEVTAVAEKATKEAEKATAKVDKKEMRNQFISQRLTLMNIQYIKFIRRFAVEKAQLDTAADILIIGVNLAGTLVGAASTKGILAAISAGTAVSRTSINKNFFQEKTVPVLITAMNAERKKILFPILKGAGQSIDEYPFAQALSDLHIYYQAGTFIGALQTIQKDSGAKEDKADLDIAQFRDTKFQPDTPTGVRIEAWSELSTENNDNLVLWLRENGLGEVGHPAFFTAPVLEAARVQAIKGLKIPPIP